MTTYMLKTRTITGALVPYNGEHRTYDKLTAATSDAATLWDVLGVPVSIVEFETDKLVRTIPAQPTERTA